MNAFFQRKWMRILLIPLIFVSLISNGNPLGEAVRSGQVSFERSEGGLRILQGSDKAIIDWESFSISSGEFTEFVQPSERSAALNRVRGATASQIDGSLRANGNVILINPNGIVIGPSGNIDVGGFIASTLDISDAEFLAGGDLNFRGASQKGIVNLGNISATGGDVFLIAATVENSGTISAPNGTVGLAAGNDVLLKEAGTPGERIFVRGASGGKKSTGVVNKGTINANIAELKAHGGNVYALAVNNEGRVAATGVSREGGQIFLRAGGAGARIRNSGTLKATRQNGDGGRIEIDAGPGGEVENAGTIDVSSDSGTGGEIYILGSQIHLEPGSLVIADGASSGGEVFIGGGQRGEDTELMNAENVTVAEGATISANGTGANAAGGQVIVFAENRLDFSGQISAAGGANGAGGFIELSGKNEVNIPDLSSRVNLGGNGTLLFDPNDITIIDGSLGPIGSSPVNSNTLADTDINNFLINTGSLIIETTGTGGSGNITFQSNTDISWMSANSLTVNADQSIFLQGGATGAQINSQGSGAIALNALGGEISVASGATISGSSGDITLNSAEGFSIFAGGSIITDAGDISITANDSGTSANSFTGIRLFGGEIISNGDGDISLTGRGGNAATTGNAGVIIQTGSIQSNSASSTAGSIAINGIGGNGTGEADGVQLRLGGSVESVNGAISIVGQGSGTGTNSNGILINNGTIESSGTGPNAAIVAITLVGTGSANGTGSAKGISLSADATVTSIDGDISFLGTGAGTGTENFGVSLVAGTKLTTTGDANVTIGGTGSNGSTGITISTSNTVGSSTATGNYTIDAGDTLSISRGSTNIETSGNVTVSADQFVEISSADITSGGDISIMSGGDATISTGAMLDATSGSGNISVTAGESASVSASTVKTAGGDITIQGNLAGTGTGQISGVNLSSATLTTTGGDILLQGTGGDSISSLGVVANSSTIETTGAGAVTIEGTGATGAAATQSAGASFLASTIQSVDGDIAITGNGGAGANAHGIVNFSDIQSTGLGNVTLNGTAGGAANSDGIQNFQTISAASGDISIVANGGEVGFSHLQPTAIVGDAAMTGDITFQTDSIDLALGAVQSMGDLTIAPIDSASAINLVDSDVGSLHLDSTEIASFVDGFNSITIGANGGSGTITVNNQTFTDPLTLRSPNGEIRSLTTIDGTGDASLSFVANDVFFGGNARTEGQTITVTGDTTLLGDVNFDATSGGNTAGADITFAGTIVGSVAQRDLQILAGTDGVLDLQDNVGQNNLIDEIKIDAASFSYSDDMQSQGDITINTERNFTLASFSGIRANGAISITANANANAGNFNGIRINGDLRASGTNGVIQLTGTSGDTTGNIGILFNGDISASQDISFTGTSQIGGVNESAILFNDQVDTSSGLTATTTNGNITINERFELNDTLELVGLGAGPFNFNISNSVPFNNMLVTGGSGLDTLDFSGFTRQVTLDASQLTGVETVIGSTNTGDIFKTDPNIATDFDFTGANAFTADLAGNDIAVTGFENVTGSLLEDTFNFLAGGSLSGDLDGGGATSIASAPAFDTLDYSNAVLTSPLTVDLENGTSSLVGGDLIGFGNIIGSTRTDDTIIAPAGGSTDVIEINGANQFGIDNVFSSTRFENLSSGSSGPITFEFGAGGSVSGGLDGGGEGALDYQNFGSPVTIDLENGTATGIGGTFTNVGEIIGSTGTSDQITLSNFDDTIEINADDSGTVNTDFLFSGIETINSGPGNDVFNFNGLATFTNPIDGGTGNDTLNIFTQGGLTPAAIPNNVNITEGQITINPTWNFSNFETVGVNTGGGNDSVTTQFTSFRQNLDGGSGTDTLNFSQAPFGSTSPVTSGGAGPVFFQRFERLFFAPDPGTGIVLTPVIDPADDTIAPTAPDSGDLLQIQLDNALQDPSGVNEGVITFADAIGNISSNIGIGALQNAFSAISIISQQGVIFGGVDANPVIVVIPFSLDGSGIQPSNLGIQLLQESLAPDANTELLAALGLDFGIFLINPDGAFAIDLSGAPTLPATIQSLLSQLSPNAQADLQNALEFPIVVLLTSVDEVAALDSSNAAPLPATILILNDLLGQAAVNELNAALGIQ